MKKRCRVKRGIRWGRVFLVHGGEYLWKLGLNGGMVVESPMEEGIGPGRVGNKMIRAAGFHNSNVFIN
jgi:hypothetical protein